MIKPLLARLQQGHRTGRFPDEEPTLPDRFRGRPRLTAVPKIVTQNAAWTGTDVATYTRDRPGMSAFALQDGVVYHAYSTYARGLDGLWGMYQWLDRAPRGRNEAGLNEAGAWWRRHDEYEK